MKWDNDAPVLYRSLWDRPDPAPRPSALVYAGLAVLGVFAGVGVLTVAAFMGLVV